MGPGLRGGGGGSEGGEVENTTAWFCRCCNQILFNQDAKQKKKKPHAFGSFIKEKKY